MHTLRDMPLAGLCELCNGTQLENKKRSQLHCQAFLANVRLCLQLFLLPGVQDIPNSNSLWSAKTYLIVMEYKDIPNSNSLSLVDSGVTGSLDMIAEGILVGAYLVLIARAPNLVIWGHGYIHVMVSAGFRLGYKFGACNTKSLPNVQELWGTSTMLLRLLQSDQIASLCDDHFL